MSRRYDKRDIQAIAQGGETAAKVVRERGERAWNRAREFDPGGVGSRAWNAGSGGTQLDEDGVPIIGSDPVGDQAVDDAPLHLDRLRRRLRAYDLAGQAVVEVIDELTRTHVAVQPENPRGFCPICAAAGVKDEPSAMRTDKKTGLSRLRFADGACRSCGDFRWVNGFDRPAEIVQHGTRRWNDRELKRIMDQARKEHAEAEERAERRTAAKGAGGEAGDGTLCPSTLNHAGVDVGCQAKLAAGEQTHVDDHWAFVDDELVTWTNHTTQRATG